MLKQDGCCAPSIGGLRILWGKVIFPGRGLQAANANTARSPMHFTSSSFPISTRTLRKASCKNPGSRTRQQSPSRTKACGKATCLGVGSGRDDISGHSPIGLVMVSRHGLLHGATHGLSPRSFPCFPGSVLPRLHGVAPFFRRRGRRPTAPLRPNSPSLTSSSYGRLLSQLSPGKGISDGLTTPHVTGGGQGTSIATPATIWAARL
jgi:hypothetical protein